MKIRRHQAITWTALFATLGVIFLLGTIAYNRNQENQYEMDPAFLAINGEKVTVDYVIKINKKKVSLDEYRYHFLNTKETMENGTDAFFKKDDGSLQRRLKSDTLAALKEVYAIEKLAKKNHLTLSKQEEEQIDNDIKNQVISLGSVAAYKKALQDSYMTNTVYRKVWKTTYYYEKLYQFYFSEGGTYYENNSQEMDEEKTTKNEIKLQAIISKEADSLNVEYGSEYDLISIDTLF